MSKKVLIVDNSSWNIYNFRMPHIQRLQSEGCEVVVLSPIDEYFGSLQERVFSKYIPLKYLYPESKNLIYDLMLIWELYKIYKNERPSFIIHFTIKPNIYGSIAARFAKVPAIAVNTGLGYTFVHPFGINRFIPFLYRMAFQKICALVLYNKDDLETIVDKGIIERERCWVIQGSGVDTNHFRPISPSGNIGKFIFLFIGRLLLDKGLADFAKAAKQLIQQGYKAEFWVIGDFAYTNPSVISKHTLKHWIERKYIRYFGSQKDIRQFLKNADALVLPSRGGEGVPRVILEAMSMGKPIITTDAVGCRETVVHGENGYLVPIKNVEALSLAMTGMLEASKGTLGAMGKKSRERALNFFDEKIIVENYYLLLRQLFPELFTVSSTINGKKVLRENSTLVR